MELVVYDFDLTITSRDTTKTWLIEFLKLHPLKVIKNLHRIICLKLLSNPDGRQLAKTRLFGALVKNLTREDMNIIADRFAKKAQNLLRYEILEKIAKHKEQHRKVLIVTASEQCSVAKIFDGIGIEVLGTQYALEKGFFNGNLIRLGCYGTNKVTELKLWLGNQNVEDITIIEAWSDCLSDLELMKMAQKRYWVHPPADLASIKKLDPDGHIYRV